MHVLGGGKVNCQPLRSVKTLGNSFSVQEQFQGFPFMDRGSIALKGFPEPVRLFEVSWE